MSFFLLCRNSSQIRGNWKIRGNLPKAKAQGIDPGVGFLSEHSGNKANPTREILASCQSAGISGNFLGC